MFADSEALNRLIALVSSPNVGQKNIKNDFLNVFVEVKRWSRTISKKKHFRERFFNLFIRRLLLPRLRQRAYSELLNRRNKELEQNQSISDVSQLNEDDELTLSF